jgi:hypothetical protein
MSLTLTGMEEEEEQVFQEPGKRILPGCEVWGAHFCVPAGEDLPSGCSHTDQDMGSRGSEAGCTLQTLLKDGAREGKVGWSCCSWGGMRGSHTRARWAHGT